MSSSYGVLLKDPTFHATVPKDLPPRKRLLRGRNKSVTRHAPLIYDSVLYLCPGRYCCGLVSPVPDYMHNATVKMVCDYCFTGTIYPMAQNLIQIGETVLVDEQCANVACGRVFTSWIGHPLSSKWCHKCRKTHSR